MKLIDAHIHLSDAEYAEHTGELVSDAKSSNVVALVSNSMDFETSIGSLKLAEKYPATVYPALGIHPWNVKTLKENELEKTLALISEQHQKKTVVAIGEIGLDYKYEDIWENQLMVFDKMLCLAEKLGLPADTMIAQLSKAGIEATSDETFKKIADNENTVPIEILKVILIEGYQPERE